VPVDDVLSSPFPLAFDHEHILADGVERARAKFEHSPLAAAFCGPVFTLAELQRVYEAVWGVGLDTRNFYRKIQASPDFVVEVEAAKRNGAGRPARLFRRGPGTVLHPPMLRTASHPSTEPDQRKAEPS
jgi:8-oxo-dGTP diphosphatase